MASGMMKNTARCRSTEDRPLEDWFEQIWVINLKRRPDRLSRFRNELEKASWPFRKPDVFAAIEGDKVGVPPYWQTGGGSYGCLRSHLVILERAIQEDVQTLLVLEDDAIFKETFAKDVAGFLAQVPADWECLMLGGQHVNSQPIPVAAGIVQPGGGGGIQRTHCYALRGQRAMKELYRTWASSAVHCDWVMGPRMAQMNTYAPQPFLVGQSEGHSDISGSANPAKFWRSPSGKEPVVVLRAPRPVMEALQARGWHGGYTRDPETGIDVGLKEIFYNGKLPTRERNNRLKEWIGLVQGEVAAMETAAICTLWHPDVHAAMVSTVVQGKVVTIAAETVEDAIDQLPSEFGLDKNSMREADAAMHVVILRAPRMVVDDLRKQGWHTGHWRDEHTGQDRGLQQIFSSTASDEERKQKLQRLARLLAAEAKNLPNGIATIWHDEAAVEMFEATTIHTIEIKATSPKEAQAQLKGAWK